jgi:hypothetical protein
MPEEPGFNSLQEKDIFLFSIIFRPVQKPIQPPIQWLLESVSPVVKQLGCETN